MGTPKSKQQWLQRATAETQAGSDFACILVVEDDKLVSDVLTEALEVRYRVVSVGSAAAALDQLGAGGLDLVLLDCLIPGGGTDLVIERAGGRQVPVVLMSGDAERAAAASAGRHKFTVSWRIYTKHLADIISACRR